LTLPVDLPGEFNLGVISIAQTNICPRQPE
jgi:hypothetical protein